MVRIFGILNVTRDSFSDGGRFLAVDDALSHAQGLRADGADVIDVGAESTHPDAETVSSVAEVERLTPIVAALRASGCPVSIDTYKPDVMRRMVALGVDYINDVRGFRADGAIDVVRATDAKLIVMHSRSTHAKAERAPADGATIVDEILTFFDERLRVLVAAGVARERIILDPGMGFFLGENPSVSLAVLRELPRLRALGYPLLVSVSRKSFIGAALGDSDGPRPVDQRGAGTLAAELWAVQQGVAYIRTHDVRALRDAILVDQAIRGSTGGA